MIDENSILVVVVLYKCKIEESISIKSLSNSISYAGWNHLDLVVYDNSPMYNNSEICNDYAFHIHYISDYTNSGVSKAYNKAVDLGVRLKKKYILLLDQDTEIPQSYCSDLSSIENNYSLIVPRLMCRNVIISPCRYRWGRGSTLSLSKCNEGVNSLKGKNFLNSGSLISISLFNQTGGFDESVPLYFSDFNFFERLKKKETIYYQMSTIFLHEMSSNDESDPQRFINRFKLYCDGAFRCKKGYLGITLMFINTFFRAVKIGIKQHSFKFINIVFERFYAFIIK